MPTCTGAGATVAFTLGITAWTKHRVRSIGGWHLFGEILDDTALASTNYTEKCPSSLKDHDPIEIEFYYSREEAIPDVNTLGTITITLPYAVAANETAGGDQWTITGTGWINDLTMPAVAHNENSTIATCQWQFDGKTEPTITLEDNTPP